MGIADLIELDIDTPVSLPSLGVYKVALHVVQIVFGFITFCIVTSIISIQRYYMGYSQAAPNYTLTMTLLSLCLSPALALFPWSKYRAHLPSIRNFFLRPRTTVIFTCFLTVAWFIAMICMTVDASDCTLDAKLQKSDTGYADAWKKGCNSTKAAAGFSWMMFFLWLMTAIISIILLWHEKKLKHAERSAAATTVQSSATSRYDEDAPTIVDMEYSEKEKQPVAHYDTVSTAPTSVSPATHPLPIPPPTAPHAFASPAASPYGTPYASSSFVPPPPMNLTSPYIPPQQHHVGSPYFIPASVYPPQQQPTYQHPSFTPESYPSGSTSHYQNSPLLYNQQQQPPYPYN